MGWLHSPQWDTKAALVEHLRHGFAEGIKVIADRVVGNHYWAVLEAPDRPRFILLALMQSGRGDGWGYKDMDEYAGPHHHDCPLSFLDLAPDHDGLNAYAKAWRIRVRQHHAIARSLNARKSALKPGDVLTYGKHDYQLLKKLERGAWQVARGGTLYRMHSRQISQALSETQTPTLP